VPAWLILLLKASTVPVVGVIVAVGHGKASNWLEVMVGLVTGKVIESGDKVIEGVDCIMGSVSVSLEAVQPVTTSKKSIAK
jgi:hypothetical protein